MSAPLEGFDQIKSQWIPCNYHHHLLVLDRLFRRFGCFLFSSKLDLPMIRRTQELELTKSGNKLRAVTFDGLNLAQ
jgi:hypothetical protein